MDLIINSLVKYGKSLSEGSGSPGEDEGIYSRDISGIELMGFGYQLEYWVVRGRKVFRMTQISWRIDSYSCH